MASLHFLKKESQQKSKLHEAMTLKLKLLHIPIDAGYHFEPNNI